MTPCELDRAVAMATGEDVAEIRRRGFSLDAPRESESDPAPCDAPRQTIDWDELEGRRQAPFFSPWSDLRRAA